MRLDVVRVGKLPRQEHIVARGREFFRARDRVLHVADLVEQLQLRAE